MEWLYQYESYTQIEQRTHGQRFMVYIIDVRKVCASNEAKAALCSDTAQWVLHRNKLAQKHVSGVFCIHIFKFINRARAKSERASDG